MAKAVRGRPQKTAARKASAPARRKAARQTGTSDKFRALVYGLSSPELDELIKLATGRRNEELATAKASFFDEIKAKAASLGVSLADIVGLGGNKAGKPSVGRAPAAARYRNPKTGETWSGRGRPARWITDLEAQGHKREEFAL